MASPIVGQRKRDTGNVGVGGEEGREEGEEGEVTGKRGEVTGVEKHANRTGRSV